MNDQERSELRAAYSRFLAADRILLTGHSLQAWPDVARDAHIQAFDDAARLVDDVWGGAIFPMVDQVGRRLLARMGFAEDDPIAFAANTHTLVYRLLSALPNNARVVTTMSEFHSLFRQLSRLAEEGLDVAWVETEPRTSLTDNLIAAIDEGTDVVALSAVLFEDAWVVENLAAIVQRAHEVGAIVVVDAYHAFNAVPLTWSSDDLYVVAGGYKYGEFGPGVCWMRLPKSCELRPKYTGWFSDFASLEEPRAFDTPVRYGAGGARFAGATFDAVPIYRARAVLDHWDRFGLTVERLRAISLRQTGRIIARVDSTEGRGGFTAVMSSRDDQRRGGFVTLHHPQAPAIASQLREQGVFVDARGPLLRMGPAPFLADDEIDRGVDAVIAAASRLIR